MFSMSPLKQQSPASPLPEVILYRANIPVPCGRMLFCVLSIYIAPFSCQYHVYTATQRVWPKQSHGPSSKLSTHSRMSKLEFGDRLIITWSFKGCRIYQPCVGIGLLAAFQQLGLVFFFPFVLFSLSVLPFFLLSFFHMNSRSWLSNQDNGARLYRDNHIPCHVLDEDKLNARCV